MKNLYYCLVIIAFAFFTCCGETDKVEIGKPLPAWQEGELDIHLISTGRGECTFQIFPDGTTFLVDASGAPQKVNKVSGVAPWRPNENVSAGLAITNYIRHFSPSKSAGHINYFLLTHHHGDHMGIVNESMDYHSSGEFQLSSLCEIGSLVIMDKILDRAYPDFSEPKEDKSKMMSNFKSFLNWTERENNSMIEKWDVGSCTQVVPVYNDSYDFKIRNIAGNGCCWTGNGTESVSYMPSKESLSAVDSKNFPDENCYSCAYMLSYGKFDFFLGGDLQFAYAGDSKEVITYDAETPLLPVVHKVEVMKANHHGCTGANSANLINKLSPDVWIVGAWQGTGQPNKKPTRRVIEANPNVDIFCTYQSNDNLGRLVSELGLEEVARHIVGRYGHVVVRVARGGDSYMVYTLEDTDEEYTVKSIHGPYTCGD